VCSPLDLSRGATALDRAFPLYRHYILRRLNHLVDAAHQNGLALPTAHALRGVESIRVWDGLVVGPFFGFRDAEDYYTRASVGPLLAEIKLPTLLIHSRADPMVPFDTVEPALAHLSPTTASRITARGGHVGFPADLDLGLGPSPGLRGQVLDWLTS
jgi:predicted alpha/beta-fold hydrolase